MCLFFFVFVFFFLLSSLVLLENECVVSLLVSLAILKIANSTSCIISQHLPLQIMCDRINKGIFP